MTVKRYAADWTDVWDETEDESADEPAQGRSYHFVLASDYDAKCAELEAVQMRLKRHEPVSLYNGRDIDSYRDEATRLRAALERALKVGYPLPDETTGECYERCRAILGAALTGTADQRYSQ